MMCVWLCVPAPVLCLPASARPAVCISWRAPFAASDLALFRWMILFCSQVMDTWGAVGFVYFLLLIFLTTFFAINLVLAVIFDTFSGTCRPVDLYRPLSAGRWCLAQCCMALVVPALSSCCVVACFATRCASRFGCLHWAASCDCGSLPFVLFRSKAED